MDDAEKLDEALEGQVRGVTDEVRALLGVAAEVRTGLRGWRLPAFERSRLYDRVLAATDPPGAGWRRFATPRGLALAGASLTVGAAVLGMALARGRRHRRPALAVV
jgi:hypothetical protein